MQFLSPLRSSSTLQLLAAALLLPLSLLIRHFHDGPTFERSLAIIHLIIVTMLFTGPVVSGKWSREEEHYTLELVQSFLVGRCPDCERG